MILKNCHLVPELSGGYAEATADVLLKGDKIEKIAPVIDIEGEVLSALQEEFED